MYKLETDKYPIIIHQMVFMSIQFEKISKSYKIRIQEGLKGFIKPNYKSVKAISNVSFEIKQSGIIGLIGENGAGKSTLIKLMTGILSPDKGCIKVFGMDPFEQRIDLMKKTGIIFGQRSLLKITIPVKYTFEWLRDMYHVSKEEYEVRLEKLSELFKIKDIINRPPRELSLGQRRKCDLVVALLHQPQLLLLDEPTIGLDYKAKATFRELLKSYVENYKITVIISSHDLNELESLCDNFIILNKGEIKFQGSFATLKSELGISNFIEVTTERPTTHLIEDSINELEKIVISVNYQDNILNIFFEDSLDKIMKIIYDGFIVSDIKMTNNSLLQALSG